MKQSILALALGILLSAPAFAGESGFIYNGKVYTVFKDGQKVGKTAEDLGFKGTDETSPNRKTASVTPNATSSAALIEYQEDNFGNRCFTVAGYNGQSVSISCLKR